MGKIHVRFFQPSWFQIKANNKVIYIDPAYLKKYYHKFPENVLFTTWPDPIDGLPDANLEAADYIFITHHHKDHCKNVTVKRLCKNSTVIFAPELCVSELGEKIQVVQPDSEFEVDDIYVKVINAYNTPNGSSRNKLHKEGEGVGYCITINNKTIYHAGDTDVIPDMKNLGRIDLALLPISESFTMNIQEAAMAVDLIKPKYVIPMHNMDENFLEFKNKMNKKNIAEVVILDIGEEFYL